MGKYELLYIVHPDLEASIDKITDRIKNAIETRGGKLTYEENWGKRKLAYNIKKSDVGIYVLWYFEAPKSSLAKIEREIRLTEEVIRFMVLSAPDKIKVKAEKPKKEAVKTEEKEEVKTEEKPDKKTVKKETVKKAKVVEPVESEEERMKQLDEKLGAIIGDDAK
jgi:small subunit ribosomal protein S6